MSLSYYFGFKSPSHPLAYFQSFSGNYRKLQETPIFTGAKPWIPNGLAGRHPETMAFPEKSGGVWKSRTRGIMPPVAQTHRAYVSRLWAPPGWGYSHGDHVIVRMDFAMSPRMLCENLLNYWEWAPLYFPVINCFSLIPIH